MRILIAVVAVAVGGCGAKPAAPAKPAVEPSTRTTCPRPPAAAAPDCGDMTGRWVLGSLSFRIDDENRKLAVVDQCGDDDRDDPACNGGLSLWRNEGCSFRVQVVENLNAEGTPDYALTTFDVAEYDGALLGESWYCDVDDDELEDLEQIDLAPCPERQRADVCGRIER